MIARAKQIGPQEFHSENEVHLRRPPKSAEPLPWFQEPGPASYGGGFDTTVHVRLLGGSRGRHGFLMICSFLAHNMRVPSGKVT